MLRYRNYIKKRTKFSENLLDALFERSSARVLAIYPTSKNNQYQDLLYSAAWQCGYIPVNLLSLSELVNLTYTDNVILHIHWLSQIIAQAKNESEAKENVKFFLGQIDRIKENGITVIWTIHNILQHNTIYPEIDIFLRMHLAKKADHIHLLNSSGLSEISDYYAVDEAKCFEVAHPSYANVHANYIERGEARFQLGAHKDEFVFLVFGSVRSYKGMGKLIKNYLRLAKKYNKLRLIIAGKPYDNIDINEFKQLAAGREDILLNFESISNDEVQFYFNAADVCVCAYERTLNSGVLLLSLSFGCPVIAPNKGGFKSIINENNGLLYDDSGDEESLHRCLERSLAYKFSSLKNIQTAIEHLEPKKISKQFFDILDEKIK